MADKNIKINLDYSDFSGGIKECQSKMGLLTEQFKLQQAQMGNNADELDKLTLAESTLNQKIELQQQVVAQALERWVALTESEDASVQQMERAHKAFLQQSTTLENMNNELESTREKMEQLSSAEETAGSNAENTANSFRNMVNSLATITSMTSALSSAVGVISEFARSAASTADDIQTMATQFGVSAQTMDQWVAIEEKVDVSAQTLGSSMSRLTREMASAAQGSDSSAQKFKNLGVNVLDSAGNMKNAEQVFYEVIDALGKIENPAQRDAAAMDLLGKSAQQLNPLIEMGSENFREMAAASEGLVPDGMEDRLNSMSDAFSDFDNALQYSENLLAGAFAPAITTALGALSRLDPAILSVVSGFRMAMQIFSSIAPIITGLASAVELHAAVTAADTAAETAHTAVVGMETAAEAGLATSALAATAALLPQVALIAGIVAMALLLAAAIYALVEAFNDESEAADDATASIENYNSAKQRMSDMSNMASSPLSIATSHFATGSTVGGAGGMAWVGEQGPELVNLPMGSTVYNHEQSTSMANTRNIFNVTIDAKNVSDFNQVVKVFSGLNQSMNRGGFVNG